MIRILYIEDNDDNIYMLKRRLERRGYVVDVALDGENGLITAQQSPPDIIILDLVLPGIDGWETCGKLRNMPETRHTPIIGLSASAMADERQRALDAGCNDFDTKPVDMTRLIEKLESLLATPG